MAGILGSLSDSTCNAHNALKNVSGYACGVTFLFKDAADPPDMHYGVVSLQRCCDKANATLLRIPGNTGCEMQFCDVQPVTSSYTETIVYGYATGSGTAAKTPVPTVTEGATIGPPDDVTNCMAFVYEGDLPDDVKAKVRDVEWWNVVSVYDDELSPEQEETPVAASPAPASWTTAAEDPWDTYSSTLTASGGDATAQADSASSSSQDHESSAGSSQTGLKMWLVTALAASWLMIAL
ncbi:hypothetical protein GGR57DRAFT_364605 [Xylariaceae sp. FL1272]|nr:hypothetical protein GGR57DRAFT_364605 [Xylariaceae sp. FL1272]